MTAETLERVHVQTPGGHTATFDVRPETSDASLVYGILAEDEYDLASLPPLSGLVLDIGAHIGIVSVALALDHPDITVTAVEPLPDNHRLALVNAAQNGVSPQVTNLPAGVTDDHSHSVEITYGWSRAENQPDEYMHHQRFIGGMVGPNETSETITVPGIGLASLLRSANHQPLRCALLKIDCEGGEWAFLTSEAVSRVERIIGEYHSRPGHDGISAIHALLDATHDVSHVRGDNVGIFSGVLR